MCEKLYGVSALIIIMGVVFYKKEKNTLVISRSKNLTTLSQV